MKTLKIALLSVFTTLTISSFSQSRTESIPVSGNCGMCEAKIEKAAKTAGATSADWSTETKLLTVKYNSSSTNAARIQQAVAAAGYDTRDFKASDEAYKKLHACCQYDRTAATSANHQCSDKCDMKDGKCTDMAACKDKGCCKAEGKSMDCCAKGDGSASNTDCCKNGKCDKHSK
jgi:copper chaperone CopZ